MYFRAYSHVNVGGKKDADVCVHTRPIEGLEHLCGLIVWTRSSAARDLIPHPLESSAEQLKVLHSCCAPNSLCSYVEAWLVVKGSDRVGMTLTPTET